MSTYSQVVSLRTKGACGWRPSFHIQSALYRLLTKLARLVHAVHSVITIINCLLKFASAALLRSFCQVQSRIDHLDLMSLINGTFFFFWSCNSNVRILSKQTSLFLTGLIEGSWKYLKALESKLSYSRPWQCLNFVLLHLSPWKVPKICVTWNATINFPSYLQQMFVLEPVLFPDNL